MAVKLLFPIAATALFFGCATDNKVQEVDTSMEVTGAVGQSHVGIDDNNQAIIQTKTAADDELRAQIWANNALEAKVTNGLNDFEECRIYLSDSRLGGQGNVQEFPEVAAFEEVAGEEKLGRDEKGNFVVVTKENFSDRLNMERKKGRSLRNLLTQIDKHYKQCNLRLRAKRVEHGLPAEKYRAKGYFNEKNEWVLIHPGENTLDDGFAIRDRLRYAER